MENKIVVTKEKIKKYLKNYIYLTKIIKARELKWILGRGPSLKEWQEGINTVEIQAINLIEDKKLSELRFYKKYFDEYLFASKHIQDNKLYKYFIYKYIKNYEDIEIQNLLKEQEISLLDNELVNYLYINLKSEVDRYDKH